jgi:hypothetical protein
VCACACALFDMMGRGEHCVHTQRQRNALCPFFYALLTRVIRAKVQSKAPNQFTMIAKGLLLLFIMVMAVMVVVHACELCVFL